MITIEGRKAYTTKEAGAVIGVTPNAIRQYILRGQLKAEKVSGRLCIFADNLKAFADGTTSKKEDA